MIRLVTIGGSGDAYQVCALLDAFRRHHHRSDVTVVGKEKYRAIADLFGHPYAVDEALVRKAEGTPEMQRTYENVLLSRDTTFYAHPCFLRSEARIDKLTMKPEASQSDMYRALLRLPTDAPIGVPTRLPKVERRPDSVLLIPEAVSWPNTQPAFWSALAEELRRAGRRVMFNDPKWRFGELLNQCAGQEWVIGPQCGVMSILCTGQFPCRKTLASPKVTEANKKLYFQIGRTFPYAYVTKFSNDDYDVEEFEVTNENYAEIVGAIVGGQNALQLHEHDPRPVMTIQAPLAPGDFLDRLAVLEVKRRRFSGAPRAAVEREYRRFLYARATIELPAAVEEIYAKMIEVHERTFDLLQGLVPKALNGGAPAASHDAAVKLNRVRVDLKHRVDAVCRAPYSEEKSYYGLSGDAAAV